MTAPGRHKESDHAAGIVASAISNKLDYSKVRGYWRQARYCICDGFLFAAKAKTPSRGGKSEPNAAYICSQMGCELVKKWKLMVPEKCWCLPVIGRLAYWAFRIGYPLNTKMIPWLSARIGRDFPFLMNHFFVLRVRCPNENSRKTT